MKPRIHSNAATAAAMRITLTLALLTATSACHRTMLIDTSETQPVEHRIIASPAVSAMPHVIIYKTVRNCDNLVPVTLSDDGLRIVSYPAPGDLRIGGRLATPTPLADGYLLDNRGISRRAAFLSYTYEEYAAMEQAPTMEQLLAHIADRDPLAEYIDCGPRTDFDGDLVEALNRYIRDNLTGKK